MTIKENNFKENIMLIVIILLLLIGIKQSSFNINSDVQKGISDKIIRLHIIANSNSDSDQNLKIKVKDKVIDFISDLVKDCENINDTRRKITNNLEVINNLASEIIIKEGYSYDVSCELGKCYFPVKKYDKFVFPEGNYEALKINIGAANGKNWWCVLYPPLCFIDETYSIVSDNSEKKLQNILTEDEYSDLIDNKKIKIKFKIFGGLFND